MPKKIWVIIAVIFGFLMVNNLGAQTGNNEISKGFELEKRLSELEKKYDIQISLLAKSEEQLKQDFQNRKNELTNAFNELKNEHEKLFNESINQLQFWVYLASGLATVFGAAVLVSYIRFFREKVILKTLAKNFDVETKNLAALLNEVKKDYTLKKKTKILVATPENHDDKFIRKFFRKMGFSLAADSQDDTPRIKFIQFSSGQSPEQGYDLILFNDEKGAREYKKEENEKGYRECQKEKTEIHNYFSSYSGQEAICFYFGPKRIPTPENIQLSYANARLQLYGNLMNALRFQEFMV